jgi:Holliday junction DNA helicase RuvB
LEFYTEDEIEKIVKRSANILGVNLSDSAAREIAKRSRATPRTANYLLKRARDFAQVHKGDLSPKYVVDALALLEIDELGLTSLDRKILEVIIDKYKGGPVGLSTIAAALSEEMATLEEVNEPYLLQLGLIERTPRGRLATPRAYEHLGFEVPEDRCGKLL